MVNVSAYEFTVQFIWLETRASERMEARKLQQPSSPDAGSELAGKG
jgi:hypothetical protein